MNVSTIQKLPINQQLVAFNTMRCADVITAYDIHRWFNKNINSLNKEITGTSGRCLRPDHGLHFVKVVEDGSTLKAEIDATWYYEPLRESPPEIALFNKYLSDITIKLQEKQTDVSLHAILKIDLMRWPNFAKTLLGSYLYEMWVYPYNSAEDIEDHTQSATKLLDYLYPGVSLDFLRIAVELGVVTNENATFVQWFNQHLNNTTIMSKVLPGDILQ